MQACVWSLETMESVKFMKGPWLFFVPNFRKDQMWSIPLPYQEVWGRHSTCEQNRVSLKKKPWELFFF